MSFNVTTRGFDVKAFKGTPMKTSQKVGCKSEGRFQRNNLKLELNSINAMLHVRIIKGTPHVKKNM